MKSGTYRLHSRFDRVINYADKDGALVSLVLPGVGAGPGNVIVHALPDPVPPHVEVTEDGIAFGPHTVSRADMEAYDAHLTIQRLPTHDELDARIRPLVPMCPQQSLAFLLDEDQEKEFETDTQKALCKRTKEGVHFVVTGQYADGARILKGLGYGLTPAGDDFLCGYLYALALVDTPHATRDTLFQAARGDNLIVNHFLEAAHKGLYYEHFKDFTRTLCEGPAEDCKAAFGALLSIGATSGTDTAAGLVIGLRSNR